MYRRQSGWAFAMVCLIAMGSLILSGATIARAEEAKKPKRSIVMAAEYPGVEVPLDEDVSIDLIFHNKGTTDETLDVWVAEKPEGWNARVKTYRYTVMGLHVPAEEDKNVTFEAEAGKDVKVGKYTFKVKAKTTDGKFDLTQIITVNLKSKEEGVKESKGIKLTTSYPVLRGPSDANFEFSLEVDSKLDKEAVFDLVAQGPEGWDINFKPAYEDKFISSLRLKENGSKTVAVAVKPTANAKEGEYPVIIRVSTSDAKAEAKLVVMLTGTYGLEVGTPSGLLSMNARQGKTANMSIYVKNTGSAVNNNVKFMSFKPENWQVEFIPEGIDSIDPGDLKQVEVAITPYEEALVGDYSVSVNVEGEKASKPIEFRVTVNASTAWGWIGIGIIVLVVAGLTGLFRWLGRR